MRRACALALLALFAASAPSIAQPPAPHSAEYALYRGGTNLGRAQVSLVPQAADDCFVYSYTARPSWLFRWATGSISERSTFCFVNGRLLPQTYRYHRDGIGAEKENFSLSFDPVARKVTDDKGMVRDWPQGSVDRLLVQLEALRLVDGMGFPVKERRLSVSIVDDDRIKEYTLAVVGSETIQVPAGEFDTIRIERINDPRKQTRFWVAPALDNLIIKVEQQRDDDPVIGIALRQTPSAGVATD